MEFERSIDIGRPVGDVFAFLVDVKNNASWEKDVVEMEYTSEGPVGVGSTGRRVEKMMGTDVSEWEITQYEESKHLGIKFESPRFQGTVAFDLEPSGDGTRLAFQMRGTTKGLVSKLLVPIFMPIARGQLRKNFDTLKGILESQQ
jgi:carbon monoxide dehydrogenase subunit G